MVARHSTLKVIQIQIGWHYKGTILTTCQSRDVIKNNMEKHERKTEGTLLSKKIQAYFKQSYLLIHWERTSLMKEILWDHWDKIGFVNAESRDGGPLPVLPSVQLRPMIWIIHIPFISLHRPELLSLSTQSLTTPASVAQQLMSSLNRVVVSKSAGPILNKRLL